MELYPYEPPSVEHSVGKLQTAGTPPVWIWYCVYCSLMALLYIACFIAGILLTLYAEPMADEPSEALILRIQGVLLAVIGLVLSLAFAAAPFLPKRKWAWIYGMVMIGIGMTSICTLIGCLPMLLFWLKPNVRTFFNVDRA